MRVTAEKGDIGLQGVFNRAAFRGLRRPEEWSLDWGGRWETMEELEARRAEIAKGEKEFTVEGMIDQCVRNIGSLLTGSMEVMLEFERPVREALEGEWMTLLLLGRMDLFEDVSVESPLEILGIKVGDKVFVEKAVLTPQERRREGDSVLIRTEIGSRHWVFTNHVYPFTEETWRAYNGYYYENLEDWGSGEES